MDLLISAEILVNLQIFTFNLVTYHALSDSRRESHLVSRLCLIVEVCPPLQETVDGIQEAVDSTLRLLGDSEEKIVNSIAGSFIHFHAHC